MSKRLLLRQRCRLPPGAGCGWVRVGTAAIHLILAAAFLIPSGCRVADASADVTNVIVIHGTGVHMVKPRGNGLTTRWWSPDSAFCHAVASEVGVSCRFVEFQWSGDNDHDARLEAGRQLAAKLDRLRSTGSHRTIYLIGHSHGGNVVLNAVNRIEPAAVAGVFLLGTPQMSVRSPSPRACDSVEESGDAEAPGCGGTTKHWLYWGRAASRVTDTIWNLYSPQDPVQTTLARWSTARRIGVVSVEREYGGVDRDRVRNGAVNWRSAPGTSLTDKLMARSGVKAHGAVHCERMGRLIGRLIAHDDASFESALEHAGLTTGFNEITDTGNRLIAPEPCPDSPISMYQAPTFDVSVPPYRVNMDGEATRPVGVLLVHGFSAAPTEMRPVAEYLHEHEPDWVVRSVLLAGHGGTMDELKRTSEVDWMKSVRGGYDELRDRCDRVAVVGLSLGAALSCRLVAEDDDRRIAALVLMAPVLDLPWPSNHLIGLYGLFAEQRAKPAHRAAYYQRHGLFSHMAYPVKGLQSVRRNGRIAWEGLPSIAVPTLIMAGRLDRLLPARQVRRIADRIGSRSSPRPRVDVFHAPGSGHVLTVEPDAEELLEACRAFLSEQTST